MRRHFVLLLSLIAWGLLMSYSLRSLPKVTVKGISGAGLAIEFAQDQSDVNAILDPSSPCLAAHRSTLLRQQALDVVFIALYWAFFYFPLAGPLCRSGPGRWLAAGCVVRIFISIAALADLAEDFGIVSVIGTYHLPLVWPFWFAVTKWALIFVVLLVLALSFFLVPGLFSAGKTRPRWVDRLVHAAGALFLAAALLGIGGVVGRLYCHGQLLPPGALLMGLGFILLLVVFWWEAFKGLAPEDKSAANFKTILTDELKEIARTSAFREGFAPTVSQQSDGAAGGATETLPFPSRGKPPLPTLAPKEEGGSAIQKAGRRNLVGLALSGGGIRSATFNLGVLQGLAEHKFLRRLHYLSTVSGGGYIGSWLAAWIFRRGTEEVEKRLSDPRTSQPNWKEPPEIRFLREYSNYLTPRLGLFGADTWTAIATYLRNLLLNQSVLVLFIAAAVLVPRLLVAAAVMSVSWFEPPYYPIVIVLVALLVLAVILIARNMAHYDSRLVPDRVVARVKDAAPHDTKLNVEWLMAETEDSQRVLKRLGRVEIWDQDLVYRKNIGKATRLSGFDWKAKTLDLDTAVADVKENDLVVAVYPWTARQAGILSLVVLPIFLVIAFLTWMLAQGSSANDSPYCWLVGGAAAAAGSWLLGVPVIRRYTPRKPTGRQERLLRLLGTTALCAMAGAIGGVVLWQAALLLQFWMCRPGSVWNVLGFGTPIIAVVFLVFSVLQVGLLGDLLSEPRREWIGRLEAWMLIILISWAAGFALAGYSPLFVLWLSQFPFSAWTTALGWVGATLAGVMGANSAKTSGLDSTIKDKLLGLTPYVFVTGLLILVSVGVNQIISRPPDLARNSEGPNQVTVDMAETSSQQVTVHVQAVVNKKKTAMVPLEEYWAAFLGGSAATPSAAWAQRVLGAFLICFLASLGLGLRVDLNQFSMHNFYRNRLVRCYLGASHRERVPNPFTGFDDGDDVFLCKLIADQGYDGPYPILGCALNLVHGKDLAWQERKAASFVMTPQYCGFDVWFEKLLRPGQWEKRGAADGYRPTAEYAYPDGGVYVGTAMAISGAAASPNMGFHSSPALAFLMTVFNVRLGQWMGNPRDPKCWRKAGPAIGLPYLLAELFGATDDDSNYVYLSDGGHFENLGLYELVKRRCRLILASDAGEDKNLAFNDLASAIRKCRADMGIDIEIKTDRIFKLAAAPFSTWHCAIGLIKYSGADRPVGKDPVKDGVLVYFKPSLTSDEPADVLNYKTIHPDFPHQPTADQWFTESQFESYRALGQHVVRTLFCQGEDRAPDDLSRIDVDDLIKRLGDQWVNLANIQTNCGPRDFV